MAGKIVSNSLPLVVHRLVLAEEMESRNDPSWQHLQPHREETTIRQDLTRKHKKKGGEGVSLLKWEDAFNQLIVINDDK